MDIDALLAPISPDLPCGPDLEYDPDFMALEQLAQGKPERQTGAVIVPAEDPDWADIARRAQVLFARTRDLRVAVLWTRAATRLDGMTGLAAGLGLLRGLLAQHWEDVHPALDPEDGAMVRLNVLALLGSSQRDTSTLLRDVRSVSFIGPGGRARLSVRDILITQGRLSAAGGEGGRTRTEVEETLRLPENLPGVRAAREALAALDGMRACLVEKVGHDSLPDLQSLRDMLETVLQLCGGSSGAGGNAMEVQEAAASAAGEASPVSVPATVLPGEIRSREDAVRALERVCEYIERTEPANPAPLFIRRGQRLMTKNFVEIMQDLAPDSLGQIRQITGLDPKKT